MLSIKIKAILAAIGTAIVSALVVVISILSGKNSKLKAEVKDEKEKNAAAKQEINDLQSHGYTQEIKDAEQEQQKANEHIKEESRKDDASNLADYTNAVVQNLPKRKRKSSN